MITKSLLMILEIFTNITTIGRSNKLPAPAKVLIKDKEKEMVAIYLILFNTPLPGHERSKPSRRHSEDHVGF
ncbi:hypothetical protein RhiirA5_504459 [Rhizophagus irregularis]|uniref:Uncharacterized protein n=1 Tax=Rhizophagus irregularis TaxID=588596 RepID=A0A2N0P4G5_9GLOM|nr:hypothetical protein RhiirA5_504459 [Rhizophagus irregularis]